MNTTQIGDWQTVNTTDVRFRLGAILEELQRKKRPFLVISRSRPKAWLCPYEEKGDTDQLFANWQKILVSKYQKIKARDLIALVRKDRDNR